jgi:hypothetical protein
MADIRQQAVATADEYRQGTIATLDDAMTRRLIASTVMTESHGGDLAASNRLGFTGRYKAGAEFLAEAGYIDRDRLDQAMSGHRSEWAWAKTGGMAAFLEDPANWKNGLSLDAYRQSPDLQDRAFKINAEHDYARAREQGFLGDDDKPGRVAGFLKAAHVVGFNSAREAMTGGRAYRDVNGVSNYDLIHDISRNRDGLDKLMSPGLRAEKPDAATLPGSVAHADHPDHARFRQIDAALAGVPGLEGEQARQRAAASIMVAARTADLQQVDHVVPGPGGSVFAVQGDLRDPSHRLVSLNVAELVAQPVEKSTAQLAALAAPADPAVDAQRQERGRSV